MALDNNQGACSNRLHLLEEISLFYSLGVFTLFIVYSFSLKVNKKRIGWQEERRS